MAGQTFGVKIPVFISDNGIFKLLLTTKIPSSEGVVQANAVTETFQQWSMTDVAHVQKLNKVLHKICFILPAVITLESWAGTAFKKSNKELTCCRNAVI